MAFGALIYVIDYIDYIDYGLGFDR